MWKPLALALAMTLLPSSALAQLKLTNQRVTYVNGLPRDTNKILPLDSFYVFFEIENLQVDKGGRGQFSHALQVTDSKGKLIFKEENKDLTAQLVLGSNSMPMRSEVQTSPQMDPGKYTMHVTVTDQLAKTKATFTQDFEVLPKAFGIVRFMTTLGDGFKEFTAPPVGYASEFLAVRFVVVGMKRDKGKFKVSLTMRILDKNGKETTPKTPYTAKWPEELPLEPEVKLEDIQWIPSFFVIPLNRPGDFTVILEARDEIGKTTETIRFPLRVLDLRDLKMSSK
jgi:hypothetical protein